MHVSGAVHEDPSTNEVERSAPAHCCDPGARWAALFYLMANIVRLGRQLDQVVWLNHARRFDLRGTVVTTS
jgi:hypothetical protein